MPITITPAVIVEIKDDPELVHAFLDWALKSQIYSLRQGGGATGRGGHVASYPVKHSAKIAKFLNGFHGRALPGDGS